MKLMSINEEKEITAKKIAQKINAVNIDWNRFLGKAHNLINELDSTRDLIIAIINMLTIPNPHMSLTEKIRWTITTIEQTAEKLRLDTQKLREFMSI